MAGKVEDSAAWYCAQEDRWELARTLLGGTEAMQAKPEYLPQFPLESASAYKLRRENAVLTNFYAQMAQRMMGLVFKEPVKVTDSLLDEALLANIDNRGRSIHAFAEYIGFQALTRGLHHILVDVPFNPGVDTLADDQALGLRPFWASIPAETCFSAYADTVANRERLGQIRYRDDKCTLIGFDIAKVERIRVLNLSDSGATYEIWSRPEGEGEFNLTEDAKPFNGTGGTALKEIPWIAVYGARREGFMMARSVMQDIAYLNKKHWRFSSSHDNIVEATCFPMLAQVGIKEPINAKGPDVALHAEGNANTHQDAEFYYVQPDAGAADPSKELLASIIDQAELLSIQLRVDPAQTATGADITQGSTTSNLVTFAHGLEQGINEALRITALYMGIDPAKAGKATVNKDFALTAEDGKRIDALIKMREDGDLTRETFWKEMGALGVLSSNFDPEVEAELLLAENLGPPPVNNNATAAG